MAHEPVVFETAGDQYVSPCVVLAIIWEGVTVSGDRCEVVAAGSHALLWAARTESTQTYLGANFGPTGVHCPGGMRAEVLTAGRVLLLLKED